MDLTKTHISYGISKLGSAIPSVNLPAGCTCRKDAPCYKKCYARKGHFIFSQNKAWLSNNLRIWNENSTQFEADVLKASSVSKFFRWHSSGDIPDQAYLEMIVRIANAVPDTKFLVFTKKFEMVNTYLDQGNPLPHNLNVVFSAWGTFLPDNPHNLPVSYICFKNGTASIPKTALHCPKYCGECVTTGCSCWHLQRGEAVYFDEH